MELIMEPSKEIGFTVGNMILLVVVTTLNLSRTNGVMYSKMGTNNKNIKLLRFCFNLRSCKTLFLYIFKTTKKIIVEMTTKIL